jgi:hypothetical protein
LQNFGSMVENVWTSRNLFMSNASRNNKRQQAQDKLTEAQDRWILVVSRYGNDLSNAEVRQARRELDLARIAYLSLGSDRKD